jgi:hypothetical protein
MALGRRATLAGKELKTVARHRHRPGFLALTWMLAALTGEPHPLATAEGW